MCQIRSFLTDAETAARIPSSGALAPLYDRHGGPAYSLARRICGDQRLAEDVTVQVCGSLRQKPAHYLPARGGCSSWLLTQTHHPGGDGGRRVGNRSSLPCS